MPDEEIIMLLYYTFPLGNEKIFLILQVYSPRRPSTIASEVQIMQNENNESKKKRFAGKGYYIALIACIMAVGISGYVFVKTARSSAVEASAEVTIPPTASAAPSAQSETSAKPSGDQTTASSGQDDLMEDAYETTMGNLDAETVQWPLEGDLLSSFSQEKLTYSQTMGDWRTHEGLDIAAEVGTPVYATQDGSVSAVYEDDFLGTVVVIAHSGDLATRYANLDQETSVAVGDSVSAGQTIGQVGHTALLETAEPDHLHFEVYENGNAVDPLDYLPE